MPEIQRKLMWNVESEEHPPRHQFYFLIINDNRGANRIEQKAKEVLQPTEDMRVLTEGALRGTGLRYKLLEFYSYCSNPTEINWNSIYKGKIFRARNLTKRESPNGLAEYIESIASSGKEFS